MRTKQEDLHQRYATFGRVQIENYLSVTEADALTDIAQSNVPWVLNFRELGKSINLTERDFLLLSDANRSELSRRIDTLAREDFQYSYFSVSLAPTDVSTMAPDSPIRLISSKIMSRDFMNPLREFVGDSAIRGLTASLTRYDCGQYLLPHDDTDGTDDRRAAFVLNLSEDWWPDWGGLLQFIDARRNVAETFTPHHNSLSLFKVPQFHAVSQIAAHAPRSRYAISGWLIA